MKAFYYKGDYYTFLDKSLSKKDICANKSLLAVRYAQRACLAPYFIREDSENVELKINDPSMLYPVQIQVLDRQEYRKKLFAMADEYCKECKRYRADEEFLGRELTLDGMCYEDEDQIRDQLRHKVEDFWASFEKEAKRYQQAIDSQEQLPCAELAQSLCFLGKVKIAFGKYNQKYYFMASSLLDQTTSLFCDYLCNMAPESLREEWEFVPYFVQNVYRYRPADPGYNVLKNAPLIRFEKKKADRPRYDITLLICPASGDEVDVFEENLLYVFSVMGENRFVAGLASLNCKTEYEKNAPGFVHIKDYSVEIQKEYMQNLRMYFRRFHYGEFPATAAQTNGRRKADQLVTTNADQLTQALLKNDLKLLSALPPCCSTVGTLTFYFGCGIKQYTAKLRAIHDQIEEFVYDSGFILPFATCYGTDKVSVDFLLTDINAARKAIRELTPMLQAFNATYTESTPYGSNTYRCDYELGIHEA